jgi:hypothetical protein
MDSIASPRKIISPELTLFIPLIKLKSEVLPAPFGPITDVKEFSLIEKLTFWTGLTPPKLTEISLTSSVTESKLEEFELPLEVLAD